MNRQSPLQIEATWMFDAVMKEIDDESRSEILQLLGRAEMRAILMKIEMGLLGVAGMAIMDPGTTPERVDLIRTQTLAITLLFAQMQKHGEAYANDSWVLEFGRKHEGDPARSNVVESED